nr:MAG TPA: hypothetical protein [Caudoviricetes sp.]
MKAAELRKILIKSGAKLLRHGGQHDVWVRLGKVTTVPRHREIAEGTAKSILKQLGIKP